MTLSIRWLLTIFTLCLYLPALSASQLQLASTESDPEAFIQNSVNVITGAYCESATDLVITGPDALVLQRFYSTKDVITGVQTGGWRVFPQRFLIIGKDPSEKSCTVGKDRFDLIIAAVCRTSHRRQDRGGWYWPLTIEHLFKL